MFSSETTRRSDQVPILHKYQFEPTLKRLNKHNSVFLASTSDSLSHLLHNTHSLTTSNSREDQVGGISSIDLSINTPSSYSTISISKEVTGAATILISTSLSVTSPMEVFCILWNHSLSFSYIPHNTSRVSILLENGRINSASEAAERGLHHR